MRVGDVVYIYNKTIVPAGNKYSLCVSLGPDLFFLINTENRALYECLPVSKKSNAFLSHDSNVGCNRAFAYSADELREAKHVGRLSYTDLENLCEHIKKKVKTLPIEDKEKILQALDDELNEYR